MWTLGIYAGESPLELQPAPKAANPVLTPADVTDMRVDAVAHPFMVIKDKRYYVFFTAKDLKSDKGGIALAESSDGVKWKFRRTVIREPFVQSYPYVFEWRNEYYLIPEAHTETSLRLYKATAFPDEWTCVGNLLEGEHFRSPTLAHYKDLWWLFTSPRRGRHAAPVLRSRFQRPLEGAPAEPHCEEGFEKRPARRPALRA